MIDFLVHFYTFFNILIMDNYYNDYNHDTDLLYIYLVYSIFDYHQV